MEEYIKRKLIYISSLYRNLGECDSIELIYGEKID
jgi:hypothetical protein